MWLSPAARPGHAWWFLARAQVIVQRAEMLKAG